MEDLLIRHCAKPPRAFIILELYSMFCCIHQSLPHPPSYTCIQAPFNFSAKIAAQWLLLCEPLFLFFFSQLFTGSSLSPLPLIFPSPHPFPLSFYSHKFPGVISKVSTGYFSAFIKVIKPLPTVPLFLIVLSFPFCFTFNVFSDSMASLCVILSFLSLSCVWLPFPPHFLMVLFNPYVSSQNLSISITSLPFLSGTH